LETGARLVKRYIGGIFLYKAAANLRDLFVGEPIVALVLSFHERKNFSRVGLPFRRPGQDAIQNFLHLIFRHDCIIAFGLQAASAAQPFAFASWIAFQMPYGVAGIVMLRMP